MNKIQTLLSFSVLCCVFGRDDKFFEMSNILPLQTLPYTNNINMNKSHRILTSNHKALHMSVLCIVLTALVSLMFTACADPEVRYVRKAVRIMDRNALFATGDEWQRAKDEALAARPANHDEAMEVVRKAASVAGGKHTFLLSSDALAEQQSTEPDTPTVELMPEGIAVITIPHFQGSDEEGRAFAHAVLDALPDTLAGVVIDLRGNTGGNMYPMIVAVHQLLPDDVLLSFRSRKGTMPITRSFCLQSSGIDARESICCPVALLTDSMTGSSGEALLLCFRGLDNTRVFGSPTAGYVSANRPFRLLSGDQLVLTTGCDVARTGEEFCDDPIQPDVPSDSPLQSALQWLSTITKDE